MSLSSSSQSSNLDAEDSVSEADSEESDDFYFEVFPRNTGFTTEKKKEQLKNVDIIAKSLFLKDPSHLPSD